MSRPIAESPDVANPGLAENSPDPDDVCPLAEEVRQWELKEVLLAALLILAVFYTVYFTRSVLFPITLAVMLNLVFKPIVLRFQRFRIPNSICAALILLAFGATVVGGGWALWDPANEWARNFTNPQYVDRIVKKLEPFRKPLDEIEKMSDKIDEVASGSKAGQPIEVQEKPPPLTTLLNSTWGFFGGTAIMVVLLYFLLAGGDRFLEKLVELMPTWRDKRRIVDLSREVQNQMSNYLFTITAINASLGLIIGLGMWWIGLSNPALWGVMAALLNYIPFGGAALGAIAVFVAGLADLDSLGDAALAPIIYVLANMLEANFITPALLGKSVSLNPVMIVLSIFFWGWLWGIGGVLLAVPLLVVLKIFFDHSVTLRPLGSFLAE